MATLGITSTRDVLLHAEIFLVGGSREDTVELLRGIPGDIVKLLSNLGELGVCRMSGVESAELAMESSRIGGGMECEPVEEERLRVISSKLIFLSIGVSNTAEAEFRTPRRCGVGLDSMLPESDWILLGCPPPRAPPAPRGLGERRRARSLFGDLLACLLVVSPSTGGTGVWPRTLRENLGTPAASFSARQRFLVAVLK